MYSLTYNSNMAVIEPTEKEMSQMYEANSNTNKKRGFCSSHNTLPFLSIFLLFFFLKRSTHKNKSSPFYHSGSEVCTKGSSVANKNIKQQQRRRRHLLTN